MPVFRFKHFTVSNSRSAMKVNTDGVLLGALMTVTGGERHLLDIGTGTGSVALMAAQRVSEASGGYEMSVEAVDIDQLESFDAGTLFARTEGIIPAPESCHAIAAAIIGGTAMNGGRGSIAGTVAGVFILGIISNALDMWGAPVNLQGLVKGSIIIVAVLIQRQRNS